MKADFFGFHFKRKVRYSTSHLPEIWRELRKIGTSDPRQSKDLLILSQRF
jgi:hypothetical protein